MKIRTYLIVLVAVVFLSLPNQAFTQWTTPEPLNEINTQYGEGWCFLSFDGLTLYFSRSGTDKHYWHQMYRATRMVQFGPFSTVTKIDSLAYDSGHVDNMWVSPDNLRIYYWRTEPGSIWRIKESTRDTPSSPWKTPQNLTELNNLGQAGNPKLSADELSIIFNIFTSRDGADYGLIYSANRNDRNSVFTNIRAVNELNTSDVRIGNISSDGLRVYFTRKDDGGYHNYMSARPSVNSLFDTPQLLSYWPEVYGLGCFSADGQTAYLGYKGDIYVSYATPNYINVISSKSIDMLLQEGINAEQVKGDTDMAIQICWQVLCNAKDPQIIAQAILQIGMCYLKKGDTFQAATNFHYVISAFPRQESIVKEAQNQLEKLKY